MNLVIIVLFKNFIMTWIIRTNHRKEIWRLAFCNQELLTHWCYMTDICVRNLTISSSDNGLLPGRHQAIIWTNDGISFTAPIQTNFSEILNKIHTFSFHLKMLSGKWWPLCLGLDVLMEWVGNWQRCGCKHANWMKVSLDYNRLHKFHSLRSDYLWSSYNLLAPSCWL